MKHTLAPDTQTIISSDRQTEFDTTKALSGNSSSTNISNEPSEFMSTKAWNWYGYRNEKKNKPGPALNRIFGYLAERKRQNNGDISEQERKLMADYVRGIFLYAFKAGHVPTDLEMRSFLFLSMELAIPRDGVSIWFKLRDTDIYSNQTKHLIRCLPFHFFDLRDNHYKRKSDAAFLMKLLHETQRSELMTEDKYVLLMNSFIAMDLPKRALTLYTEGSLFKSKNVDCHSPALKACAQLGLIEKAQEILHRIKKRGVLLDDVCHVAMITLLIKSGEQDAARMYYREVTEPHEVPMTADFYEHVIKLFTNFKMDDIAITAYKDMIRIGYTANMDTLISIIDTMEKRRELHVLEDTDLKPNEIVMLSIRQCFKAGNWQGAIATADMAISRTFIQANVEFYEMMICGLCGQQIELAQSIFDQMLEKNVKPSIQIYKSLAVVYALRENGHIAIMSLIESMISHGYHPPPRMMYNELLHNHARNFRYEEVLKVYRLLEMTNIGVDRYTFYYLFGVLKGLRFDITPGVASSKWTIHRVTECLRKIVYASSSGSRVSLRGAKVTSSIHLRARQLFALMHVRLQQYDSFQRYCGLPLMVFASIGDFAAVVAILQELQARKHTIPMGHLMRGLVLAAKTGGAVTFRHRLETIMESLVEADGDANKVIEIIFAYIALEDARKEAVKASKHMRLRDQNMANKKETL